MPGPTVPAENMLFVYVFGGTLCNGIGGASGGRQAYIAYVTPGIILWRWPLPPSAPPSPST